MSTQDLFEMSYLDVASHKMMLQDVVRTEAYERAIKKAVKPGCTVIDFGTGTGVLSIFSSRSGAGEVHAIDRTKFIRVAQQIAKKNNAENITFHHCDHTNFKIDGKADVLVSEWMGHFLFYEDMLGPLLKIRDKFLKKGGVMIPKTVSLHAGLLTDEEPFEDMSFFRQTPYGIDFSPIADVPFEQVQLEHFDKKQLMEPWIELGSLNLETLEKPPEALQGSVVATKDATVYGICGWFGSDLVDGIKLGTGPDDPYTHWNQMFFPLEQPFEVKKGKTISIEIILPNDEEPLGDKWIWRIFDGSQSVEHDNMRFREREEPNLKGGILPKLP